MKIKNNVSLKEYTTLKIGGIAKNFYIVETEKDLKEVMSLVDEEIYIIANGSNILINDKKVFNNVIYMNEFKKIINTNNDITTVSASVKIQELINYINKNEQGGIEYLYSVPATVGGAIYMNAGRGKQYNKSISDYLVNVRVFDGKEIITLRKEECEFKYRESIFKKKDWIILEADFKFDYMTIEESTKIKKERIEYSKKIQDINNKNAGSVFRKSNMRIMNKLKGIGWKNGVAYSKKTINWFNNNGNGTYKQAKFLIIITRILHRLFFKEIELEYIEWK